MLLVIFVEHHYKSLICRKIYVSENSVPWDILVVHMYVMYIALLKQLIPKCSKHLDTDL